MKITDFGTLWEKHEKSRVYIDEETILAGIDMHVSYYNTGNVSSAGMAGKPLSNNKARQILADIHIGKIYYDNQTNEFYSRNMPDWIFVAVKKYISDQISK